MDFLRTTEMETLMTSRAGVGFSPNLALCRAYLAQAKTLPAVCETKDAVLRNLVLGTIYYARQMELLDGVEATAILEELHNTLGFFYRENYIQWSEMFPMNEFQNILEIAVRAGLRLYVCQKIEKYPATLQCVLSSGLQTTISIRQDSIFEVLSTSEVDISMLRLLLELGACPNEPFESGTKTTIWEHFLHERVRHHDMVPTQWHMAKFLPPDEQSSAPKVTTNAYDVCELVILHVKGNGLLFPWR